MTFGSLFAGIGGFDLGLERAGLKCAWQVEKDNRCQSILNRHFPESERFRDVKEVGKDNLPSVGLVCGGFPCQDVSVAGRRKGLSGTQSGLWHEFRRVLAELRPGLCLIENVPGLLSANGGRDFAIMLRGLADIGYRVCWRVLDAQWFGVAQRRRRVFIVGSLGDGRSAEILFERDNMCGHPEAIRKARQVAPTLFASSAGTDRVASAGSEADFCIVAGCLGTETPGTRQRCDASDNQVIAGTLPAEYGKQGGNCMENGMIAAPRVARQGKGPFTDPMNDNIVAWNWQSGGDIRHGFGLPNLQASQIPAVGVRRLMHIECERLLGFPDGCTDRQAESVTYRPLGNAVCVNVAEWIGRQIMQTEKLR